MPLSKKNDHGEPVEPYKLGHFDKLNANVNFSIQRLWWRSYKSMGARFDMKKIVNRYTKFTAATVLAAVISTASLPIYAQEASISFTDMISKFELIPKGIQDSEMLAKATTAINYLRKMDLPRAQLAINEALQLDARNSYLHFLNGFVYHLQAKQGDIQKAEIAIEGYQQALRIDPSNWIAQEFLGLAYMDLKQFERAKAQFSNVLLMTPESSVSIYGLMVSSYLTGDATTACAMADQFKKTSSVPNPAFVRSSIAVYASCGNFTQARVMRENLRKISNNTFDAERIDRRVAQWQAFYQRQEQQISDFTPTHAGSTTEQLAQSFTVPSVGRPPTPPSLPNPSDAKTNTEEKDDDDEQTTAPALPKPPPQFEVGADGKRMILIDVVLLSTQEVISTSKGINLLSTLTLQLGGASSAPAFSRTYTSSVTNNAPANVTTAITRAVTIPALTYSLNIANASNSINEVLARPTLAAIEGMPSEFFSGTNLSAGVVSTSTQGGTTVVPLDKRFGIKLGVTPLFLPNGKVQLKVDAQRTALTANNDNPKVAYQIEIAEILANANVIMNVGETLVLSGLSEKSSSTTRDGVPGLQEIPLVQYLFSNKKTNDIQRSVLVLVTPRVPIQVAEVDKKFATTADSLKTLRQKFGLAANVPPNVEAIMNQMKPDDFFREFRQGDVTMEKWERMRSTGDRLREALGFLYY